MATSGEEESLKVWETDTFQTTLVLPGNISKPQFSPDGSLLVRGFEAGRLDVWKIASDEELQPVVDAQYLFKRGSYLAHHQHWKRALDDFDRALAIQSKDEEADYGAITAAQFAMMVGDQERHRELSNAAIANFEKNGIGAVQLAARWAGTVFLIPGVADENALMRQAAQQAWDELHNNPTGFSLLYCLLRNEEYEELIERADEFGTWSKWGVYHGQKFLFQAIAYYETGRIEEANTALFKGLRALSVTLPPIGEGRSLRASNSDWFITSIVIHREACERALEKLNAAIKSKPDDQALLFARATLHRHWQRWPEAATDYGRLLELDKTKIEYIREAAISALMSRRTMQYQHLCSEAEKLLEDKENVEHAYQIGRLCSLYPDSIKNKPFFIEHIESALKSEGKWHKAVAAVALLYRLEKYEEAAVIWEVVKNKPKAWQDRCVTRLWHALIQARLGNIEEAKKSYRYANERIQLNHPPPGFMIIGELTSIELTVLSAEARQVMESLEGTTESEGRDDKEAKRTPSE